MSTTWKICLLLIVALTTEPHDELHAAADLDGAEPVHQEGEGEDVGRSTYQDQNQAPDDQLHSEGGADGKDLHANIQEHHGLCMYAHAYSMENARLKGKTCRRACTR